ncbi:FadR/GntR family transcriptional regulator [Mesorhizobium sp.]|uniref:FadR/GntR family transcriptional regulator n=2 Tax=Mesorhizobium TaxID=68287 RepID=UPI0025FE7722|nr:FCD domain-containing protein [Mesorhizobium sp.]
MTDQAPRQARAKGQQKWTAGHVRKTPNWQSRSADRQKAAVIDSGLRGQPEPSQMDANFRMSKGTSLMSSKHEAALALIADHSITATVRVVVDTLLARITSQQYTTDERLPSERTLAGELGVARNTVREALDILEKHGFIRRRAGSGSFVKGQAVLDDATGGVAAETSPLDLLVMRGIIEPDMMRLAIINMSPRAIEGLSETLSAMEGVQTDAAEFARLEDEFHRQVARGAGNPLLTSCYDLLIQARRQSFRAALNRRHLTPRRIQDYQRRYNTLLNAIIARDIESAVEFTKLLLIEEQKLLLQED